jgi:hypothetical protein
MLATECGILIEILAMFVLPVCNAVGTIHQVTDANCFMIIILADCNNNGSYISPSIKKQTPWPLVRERTIPTERQQLVGEM